MERSYIYLFVLFVNFYAIRYGDTVEQTTCTFSRSFRATNCAPLNVWGGGDYYIGANQAGKRPLIDSQNAVDANWRPAGDRPFKRL